MDATPYWAVSHILGAAEANWHGIDGSAAAVGVDPGDLPLGRFCNYVDYWLAERMTEAERAMWESELATPPPEALSEVSTMTEEQEGQAFLAFQAALGGGHG